MKYLNICILISSIILQVYSQNSQEQIPNNCINNCTGNGVCTNNTCDCSINWTGNYCQTPIPSCQQNCSGHGVCLNGVCQCNQGWVGLDCSAFEISINITNSPHAPNITFASNCSVTLQGITITSAFENIECSGTGNFSCVDNFNSTCKTSNAQSSAVCSTFSQNIFCKGTNIQCTTGTLSCSINLNIATIDGKQFIISENGTLETNSSTLNENSSASSITKFITPIFLISLLLFSLLLL
ncbi:tenascin C [Tieghemostelium lacteum]|uniref:Tenascin C n=1 Tax=Tieghemostelium lacteum TaxID=361077 RepID=A0A151Z985_TIELA|nr:tenascin C [Tieghemostelium lacteum]|eukprot:KYQ90505.1 tenascin C [Tieghemostelium lacteum]